MEASYTETLDYLATSATPIARSNSFEAQDIRRALFIARALERPPTTAMLQAAQDAWLADPAKRTSVMWQAMVDVVKAEAEASQQALMEQARLAHEKKMAPFDHL